MKEKIINCEDYYEILDSVFPETIYPVVRLPEEVKGCLFVYDDRFKKEFCSFLMMEIGYRREMGEGIEYIINWSENL